MIKKMHYLIVYFALLKKGIDKTHAHVMAEQYIYFYYNK